MKTTRETAKKASRKSTDRLEDNYLGEVLEKDFLIPLKVSVRQLSKGTGIPERRIRGIIKGEIGITAEEAKLLGDFFKTGAEFWVYLQAFQITDQKIDFGHLENAREETVREGWRRKVLPGFKVRIPREIRKRLDLKVGDKLETISRGNALFLIPIKNRPRAYKRILELALDLFKDRDSATLWLHRAQFGLGGKRPIDVMGTKNGVEEVHNLIMRIRHGICC